MYFAMKLGLAGLNLITKSIRQAKMVGAQAVYQNKNQNQNIDITNQNF